jgi:hypothetical protein
MPLIRCRRFYCYFDNAKIEKISIIAKYYSKNFHEKYLKKATIR